MIRLIGLAAILALLYSVLHTDPPAKPTPAALAILARCEATSADAANGAQYKAPCAAAVNAMPAGPCRAYARGMLDNNPDGMRWFGECLEVVRGR